MDNSQPDKALLQKLIDEMWMTTNEYNVALKEGHADARQVLKAQLKNLQNRIKKMQEGLDLFKSH